MIQKNIHQIWIQGEHYLPDEYKVNVVKLRSIHPTWKIYFWDEIQFLSLIKDEPFFIEKYYQFTYLHQKVDFAKLVILFLYGGIFIDTDTEIVKPLDALFRQVEEYDFVISYTSSSNKYSIENLFVCNKWSGCYNNGIIIARKHAGILKYLYGAMETECNLYFKPACITYTTGPVIFNKLVKAYIANENIPNKSRILVLDSDYLEPCVFDKCDVTDNTYILHKHKLSWVDDNSKYILDFIYSQNRVDWENYFIIGVLIMVTLFAIFSMNHKNKK